MSPTAIKTVIRRLAAGVFGLSLAVSAAIPAGDDAGADADAVKAKIAKAFGVDRSQIRPSPVSGWYEVQREHEFGYVSTDGKFLLRGDLVDMATGKSLTEEQRKADRLAALQQLGSDSMIEFDPAPPVAAKYLVTVFTDLDCPYCRKMHSQIADYNAKGIAVRYAFFPRHGLNSPTYYQAISVWCSGDRRAALTRAKLGQSIPSRKCDNPVDKELNLALKLGITGTPGIILPDGTLHTGYAEPDELAEMLAKSDAEAADAAKAAKAAAGLAAGGTKG